MRTWEYKVLENNIEAKRMSVEKTILYHKTVERLVRRRNRDHEEQDILDYLCIKKWKDAENQGKIKYISNNEWHYEY